MNAPFDEIELFEAHGEILHLRAELDRLRADNRHLLEAMTSIACRTVDPVAAKIATDTLGRVKP